MPNLTPLTIHDWYDLACLTTISLSLMAIVCAFIIWKTCKNVDTFILAAIFMLTTVVGWTAFENITRDLAGGPRTVLQLEAMIIILVAAIRRLFIQDGPFNPDRDEWLHNNDKED